MRQIPIVGHHQLLRFPFFWVACRLRASDRKSRQSLLLAQAAVLFGLLYHLLFAPALKMAILSPQVYVLSFCLARVHS